MTAATAGKSSSLGLNQSGPMSSWPTNLRNESLIIACCHPDVSSRLRNCGLLRVASSALNLSSNYFCSAAGISPKPRCRSSLRIRSQDSVLAACRFFISSAEIFLAFGRLASALAFLRIGISTARGQVSALGRALTPRRNSGRARSKAVPR